MNKIGEITLNEHVIVADPSFSIREWCVNIVESVCSGIYECFEDRDPVTNDITKLVVLKKDVKLEDLEFELISDEIGVDKDLLGIFDLDYLKQNKQLHDKEWRKMLSEATLKHLPNPNYVSYENSKEFKSLVITSEKKKRMLAERSRFRPELIKALDEIFVYDDIPKFSLEVMLARFPSKYLDSVAKFINDKVVAKNKYLESIHSKETLDEPITTCVDEKCVVTRPNPDMATYDFFVGYNEESYIAGMIIDFNSSSEKEEEKSLFEQNEEYEREKQDFDNMNFDILFHKYEDVQLTDDELDDSSTIELINSKKNLMSYDEELEDDEDEFLDDEDEEESVKLSSDVQAALDLFQKEKEASDHFLFEQYYDDGKEYTDSDYLLEYSDEDEEEDDDDEDFLASMIR